MGTEVLYPQNCLVERLGSVPSTSFYPRRKPYPNPNPNPNPRPSRRPDAKKRREVSPKPLTGNKKSQNLVMGQVTILRRGESLDTKESRSISKEKKKKQQGKEVAVLTSDGAGDLMVLGTERLGPDPEMVPKQIRLKEPSPAAAADYAGSAFSSSPSPRALPLPSFSRKKGGDGAGVPVDHSATKDLRRLLRLE